jgi:hypothetical protein
LDILNLAGKVIILVMLPLQEKPVGRVKEFTQIMALETTLHKWEPMELKVFKILTFGPTRKY